jgi:hypothetical protein
MDYRMYYKDELLLDGNWSGWDIFISAYNLSERLGAIFSKVTSDSKYWLAFPEYLFEDGELPHEGELIQINNGSEAEQMLQVINAIGLEDRTDASICIDSTGFLRAQLLFLLAYLKKVGFLKIDFIYTEPSRYSKKENTEFSGGSFFETRQVIGYQGNSNHTNKKDLLIVSAGYDTNLTAKVAQKYENSEVVPILGFPSLRADMFQENILKSVDAEESFSPEALRTPLFAPASDPFEMALVIKNYIEKNDCLQKYEHIYLCPLSTKPQVLGIGLVFLNEFENTNVSVMYPFTESYSKETSIGVSKIWKYTFEF